MGTETPVSVAEPGFLGADKFLERARHPTEGRDPSKVVSLEQVMRWYENMPSTRTGALYDLIRLLKTDARLTEKLSRRWIP